EAWPRRTPPVRPRREMGCGDGRTREGPDALRVDGWNAGHLEVARDVLRPRPVRSHAGARVRADVADTLGARRRFHRRGLRRAEDLQRRAWRPRPHDRAPPRTR